MAQGALIGLLIMTIFLLLILMGKGLGHIVVHLTKRHQKRISEYEDFEAAIEGQQEDFRVREEIRTEMMKLRKGQQATFRKVNKLILGYAPVGQSNGRKDEEVGNTKGQKD